jgi:hypothetical protein
MHLLKLYLAALVVVVQLQAITFEVYHEDLDEFTTSKAMYRCPAGSITVTPSGVCIHALIVDNLSVAEVLADQVTINSLSANDCIIDNDITIGSLSSDGILHNDATGLLSSSLIVNADIDPAAAIVDTKLATISTAGKVANSATTATSANTASAIVVRDASGNFIASTITAALSGNATSATTATNFSGSLSGDVTGTQGATVVSAVGGQTASNIAAGVVLANASTDANTANAIVRRNASGNFTTTMVTLSGTTTNSTDAATKAYVDSAVGAAGTSANTPNTLVLRNGSGNFSAGNISVIDVVASGDLVLTTDPSTSTAGAIMKGSNSFIHNTGTSNTFAGISAGNFTTTGSGQNSVLGKSALTANTTGANNTAVGFNALSGCTTGSNNIAVGSGAGTTLTTGSNNVYIAANAGSASEAGAIRIGTTGNQTACFISSIGTVTLSLSATAVLIDTSTGKLGVLLSSEKFKRNIRNIDVVSNDILNLRPVIFTYKDDESNTDQFGLIAEEVDKIFPAIVIRDENGEPKSVQYHVLPILLLNEMKKQQATINQQNATIEKLTITVENIEAALDSLQRQMSAFAERIEA